MLDHRYTIGVLTGRAREKKAELQHMIESWSNEYEHMRETLDQYIDACQGIAILRGDKAPHEGGMAITADDAVIESIADDIQGEVRRLAKDDHTVENINTALKQRTKQ